MATEFARGKNYLIEIESSAAVCRVWQRPDLTSSEGAACAQEKIGLFAKLATQPQLRGLVFDLRSAPPVVGPNTQVALMTMLGSFERAGRTIVVLFGENMLQRLQLERLVRTAAPRFGKATHDLAEAMRLVDVASPRG